MSRSSGKAIHPISSPEKGEWISAFPTCPRSWPLESFLPISKLDTGLKIPADGLTTSLSVENMCSPSWHILEIVCLKQEAPLAFPDK